MRLRRRWDEPAARRELAEAVAQIRLGVWKGPATQAAWTRVDSGDVLQGLGAILDEAVEDELLESNPARGKRMRVRVPKPVRTFLEMDELALLLEAAGEQDLPVREANPHPLLSAKTLQVARLVERAIGQLRSPGG